MTAGAGPPVLLDVSRLVWRAWIGKLPTGIDRTALAYVEHFRARARAVVQRGGHTRTLSRHVSQRLFDILLAGGAAARGRLMRLAAAGLMTGEAVRPGTLYLNVGHTGLDRPGHARWLDRVKPRAVYFVHDLIPLTHPEYCRVGEPDKHRRRITAMLDHGAGIIGNSRETIDELASFARREARAMPTALVAPLGIDIMDGGAAPVMPVAPSFVTVGTIEARKNHLLLLNIWAELARSLGPQCPQLLVIGQRGWESEQVVDMFERCEAIRACVVELPRCTDAQLSAHIRGARALLFPSFVEGYGLPLVEALACGTPVIASDLRVFRELAGDIPDYLSPIDGLGWRDLILDYARPDSARRADQIARLPGWQPPSWERHFSLVDRWLAQMPA